VSELASSPSTRRERAVSASALVAAPSDAVFALLADPHRHHELDGSGSVRRAVAGPRRLQLGDRFGMHMRIGLPYRITNRVVELEPDRRIAWCHFARAIAATLRRLQDHFG
jgi:uncharacterized protein YndB with AHSA1/START domain